MNRLRGSYPRCRSLITCPDFAERITGLINIEAVIITKSDFWECEALIQNNFLGSMEAQKILTWWLAVVNGANTPNWDIASTCTINDKKGLVLIEAKAHDAELLNERKGKSFYQTNFYNHVKIGHALSDASAHLQSATGLSWAISRDICYQLSNRFGWAWKLAALKIPVVLIYMGFLNAYEMRDLGAPFINHDEWEEIVLEHSSGILPVNVWGEVINIDGTPLIPLIRSVREDLPVL